MATRAYAKNTARVPAGATDCTRGHQLFTYYDYDVKSAVNFKFKCKVRAINIKYVPQSSSKCHACEVSSSKLK